MASQYKTIDGVKYERDLLNVADAASKPINMTSAAALWYAALDGNKVTETESRTLEYIMKEYDTEAGAQAWIKKKLQRYAQKKSALAKKGGKTAGYTKVDGVSYDAALLEEADGFAKQGAITADQSEDLLDNALDGAGITFIEKKTLEHIANNYKCEADAATLLKVAVEDFLSINHYGRLVSLDAPADAPVAAAPSEAAVTGSVPAAPTSTDALSIGVTVEAHSLQNAALNGARGRVVGFQDDRVRVELPGGEKALKRENVKLVEASAETAVVPASTALVPVEQWAKVLVRSSLLAQKPDIGKKVLEGKLADIFKRCDSSGDGKISRIELVKACRRDPQIAGFFGLSRSIQEGATRDRMEVIFQAMDKDDSREVCLKEFQAYWMGQTSGDEAHGGKRLTSANELPESKRLKSIDE